MNENIIDVLYSARYEDFEYNEIKKDRTLDDGFFCGIDEMRKIASVFNEEERKLIEKTMDEVTKKYMEYNEKWNKKYYKLGIQDGIRIQKELLNKECKVDDILLEKFFNGQNTDFNDFIDNYKVHHIYKDKNYDNNRKEISSILEKYEKIRDFIEDEKISEFSKEELEALLKLISLWDSQNVIENAYIFKLGIQEGGF